MAKVYDDIKDNHLDLKFSNDETISVFVTNDLQIKYDLSDGNYKILIFFNSESDLHFIENGSIRNSNVLINYLDLNNIALSYENNIDVYEGSNLNVNSIFLGVNHKNIKYNLVNKQRDSVVNIANNVVCLKDSDFSMDVVGKICKGAKNSKCHQKNRCLTFENPKQSRILPTLLIDENDVEASHSLSSGTIDSDVLFYMNSRGLTKEDALKLLLVSYLIPSEDFYKDYLKGEEIKDIVNKKVSKICLI